MIPIELKAWAMRHHVGQDALAELSGLLGAVATPTESTGSEARVQSLVRLAAPAHGSTNERQPARCGKSGSTVRISHDK